MIQQSFSMREGTQRASATWSNLGYQIAKQGRPGEGGGATPRAWEGTPDRLIPLPPRESHLPPHWANIGLGVARSLRAPGWLEGRPESNSESPPDPRVFEKSNSARMHLILLGLKSIPKMKSGKSISKIQKCLEHKTNNRPTTRCNN
jgi:hypothetical protein